MIHTCSSIRDWRTCRRLYRYRHVDLVRAAVSGKALNVGRAVHRGLELFATGSTLNQVNMAISAEHGDIDVIEQARCRAMLHAYHTVWSHTFSNWKTIEAESEFRCALGRGELAGKRDLVQQHIPTRTTYLTEYKTSSEEIQDIASDYWRRLAIDVQITVYQWQTDADAAILYDVLRKPKGGPKLKVMCTRRKGESDEELAKRKEDARETLQEFEDRMYQELITEPAKWFVRREVHRTHEQSKEIIDEMLEDVSDIENYFGLYPRNDTACRSKFGTCIYLGVCAGTETLEDPKFMKMDQAHPELDARGEDDYADCPL